MSVLKGLRRKGHRQKVEVERISLQRLATDGCGLFSVSGVGEPANKKVGAVSVILIAVFLLPHLPLALRPAAPLDSDRRLEHRGAPERRPGRAREEKEHGASSAPGPSLAHITTRGPPNGVASTPCGESVGIRGHRTVLGLGSFSEDVSGDWGLQGPKTVR